MSEAIDAAAAAADAASPDVADAPPNEPVAPPGGAVAPLPERPGGLAAALVRARAMCPPTVFKAGRNRDQNYRFVGHEQVLVGGARAALLANGLVLEQQSVEYVGELVMPSKGSTRPVWRYRGIFVLLHAPSGQERLYSYEATTQPNDKAAYVASTALDRVAHLRVLALAGSDEENPEHDSHDNQARDAQAPQRTPQGPYSGPARHGDTLPAPGGPPPPTAGQLALVRSGAVNMRAGGSVSEQVDMEHAAKQATYNRHERQLQGRAKREELHQWLLDVMAERLADDLKMALWQLFARHAHAAGFDPNALKANAQRALRGDK